MGSIRLWFLWWAVSKLNPKYGYLDEATATNVAEYLPYVSLALLYFSVNRSLHVTNLDKGTVTNELNSVIDWQKDGRSKNFAFMTNASGGEAQATVDKVDSHLYGVDGFSCGGAKNVESGGTTSIFLLLLAFYEGMSCFSIQKPNPLYCLPNFPFACL
ncbi:putative ribonucleoprotein, chloroplast [Corchorus olitorius]|uniref:Ribonucleoprotein, chloroplast n=1 Tax=Corchorus olitorius TaxID=93759 RepID=A0A1R3I9A8_9ROSI|nr:putative ribonucleoprotein, chloroplast [Corchorus olitorius]